MTTLPTLCITGKLECCHSDLSSSEVFALDLHCQWQHQPYVQKWVLTGKVWQIIWARPGRSWLPTPSGIGKISYSGEELFKVKRGKVSSPLKSKFDIFERIAINILFLLANMSENGFNIPKVDICPYQRMNSWKTDIVQVRRSVSMKVLHSCVASNYPLCTCRRVEEKNGMFRTDKIEIHFNEWRT